MGYICRQLEGRDTCIVVHVTSTEVTRATYKISEKSCGTIHVRDRVLTGHNTSRVIFSHFLFIRMHAL